MRLRHSSKELFKEGFTVRRPVEEVLYMTWFMLRSIKSYHKDVSNLTFRESISSRLPPGPSILSRYRLPLTGSSGSALNTVAAQG